MQTQNIASHSSTDKRVTLNTTIVQYSLSLVSQICLSTTQWFTLLQVLNNSSCHASFPMNRIDMATLI